MMTFFEWLRSLRRTPSVTASGIRRELHALKQEYLITVQQGDLLALDAVSDEIAGARWNHLHETALELARRTQILTAALPAAEAREAEIARQAEEQTRQARMQDFERRTQEAQKFIDAVLGSLPSGEVLTQARDMRDVLRTEALGLRPWSNEVYVRRPLDPLDAIHAALALRVQRIERSRWIGASPITLKSRRAAS